MKKSIITSLLFFTIYLTVTAQYNITSLQNITLTLSKKDYTGKYVGEVNETNQPNGYGLFTFKDSVIYMIGHFVNGELTGYSAMLDSNTNTAVISERENGIRKGSYFIYSKKDLRYQKNENGLSYPVRISNFYQDRLVAICRSGDEVNKPTRTTFYVKYNDVSSPTVEYSSILDKEGYDNGPLVLYNYKYNSARKLMYNRGVPNNNGTSYNYDDINRESQITTHLNNNVPYWLKDACFREFKEQNELIFLKNAQLLGQNTAYGMSWIINESRYEALLKVTAFTNWIKPVGFLQQIEVSNAETYNYSMGNFYKYRNDIFQGVGVMVQCNKSSNNFFLSAGNLSKSNEGIVVTNRGFDISFTNNTFRICIGDFENNTAMGNGYYIEPSKQLFFRGHVDVLYKNAIGEAVVDGNTKPGKYKLANNEVTFLDQIPAFERISQSDLFNVPFDTDVR